MGIFTKLLEKLLADQGLASLNEEQATACIEALVLCIDIDGRVTEEERERLQREIKRLPWAWRHSREEIEAAVNAAHIRVKTLATHEAREAHALRLGHLLPHDEARETIYRMLVAITWADGVHPREVEILEMFRKGLEVAEDRARRIADELRDSIGPIE